ncbi:hypothetical protein Rumeso_03975 [Rubellimicrobium mesophilum DSM 19309]|uniref:Uncharacterized protein n=1 Tax=Rubellimicrobium mesophilum DSM 19309 TaxID=442562 RepID=A0A017HJU5_9RHOB|nr:hypothetical protein Rumeso_03975 [Rubellimicrobium mesophilum DSM 19309]
MPPWAEDRLDRGHDPLDPRGVGDLPVLDRDVQVNAGQHALAAQVHVVQRLPGHAPLLRFAPPEVDSRRREVNGGIGFRAAAL